MKAEYVNSFYKATKDVFQLMFDIDPQREGLKVVEDAMNSNDTSIVLGVTGDLRGTILFNFPKTMVLEMIKIVSGIEMKEVDNFASSALGEVANIIGGNAVTELSKNNYICDITPPQVFVGKYKTFSLEKDKALLLSLTTPIGDFDINIFLKEK